MTARRCLARMVSWRGTLWPTYKALDRLKAYDFGQGRLGDLQGKMVPGIMGCDDVLTLVEAWTKNLSRGTRGVLRGRTDLLLAEPAAQPARRRDRGVREVVPFRSTSATRRNWGPT